MYCSYLPRCVLLPTVATIAFVPFTIFLFHFFSTSVTRRAAVWESDEVDSTHTQKSCLLIYLSISLSLSTNKYSVLFLINTLSLFLSRDQHRFFHPVAFFLLYFSKLSYRCCARSFLRRKGAKKAVHFCLFSCCSSASYCFLRPRLIFFSQSFPRNYHPLLLLSKKNKVNIFFLLLYSSELSFTPTSSLPVYFRLSYFFSL